MLCRRAINDFELGGKNIKAGQNLLYLCASANRDCAELQRADELDIFRDHKRDLTYGTGGHKCLGMHLASMGATILFEELFKKITDYELLEDSCQRVFWEHLSGFSKVPIKIMFK